MPLTTKVFQFGCNSSRMFSTTPGYNRTVFGSSGGAQDKMRDHQGIDRETVDVMHTNNWGRKDNNMPVKEEIKLMVREEMFRAKQEQRGKISNAWKQFE